MDVDERLPTKYPTWYLVMFFLSEKGAVMNRRRIRPGQASVVNGVHELGCPPLQPR
jgi:hypothetical protein